MTISKAPIALVVLAMLCFAVEAAHGANPKSTLSAHKGAVNAVAFHPKRKLLASAGADGVIVFWRANDGKKLQRLRGHKSAVLAMAFSADGTLLASGDRNGRVHVWRVQTGTLARTWTKHRGAVSALAFSPKGHIVASVADDRTIQIWNAKTGAPLQALTGHRSAVNALAFHPTKKRLASAGAIVIYTWAPLAGRRISTAKQPADEGIAIVHRMAHRGPAALVTAGNQGIHVWDLGEDAGEPTQVSKRPSRSLAVTPDGKQVVSAWRNRLYVAPTAGGKTAVELGTHRRDVRDVACSPDGALIASGSADGVVKIWSVPSPTTSAGSGSW